MKKIIILIILLAAALCLPAGSVFSQMSSAGYGITSGYPVGGGGASSSAGYGVIGNFGFGPMGISTSAGYSVHGGALASLGELTAFSVNYGTISAIAVTKVQREVVITHENETGAVSGVFYYRPGGAASYTSAAMTAPAAGELMYLLTADLITPRGLEYYIEVSDAGTGQTRYVGSAADPYRFISNLTNAQCRRPTAMPEASYRIVGLPVDLPGVFTAEEIFGDDMGSYDTRYWKMGIYDNALDTVVEYPELGEIGMGIGYWLIARGGKTYGAAGYSVARPASYSSGGVDYWSISLDEGWNLLANPFAFDIIFDDVLIRDNGVTRSLANAVSLDRVEDAAYWYNGSDYDDVAVIPAWDGFFFNVLDEGAGDFSILFPYEEATGGTKSDAPDKTPVAENNWDINLKLTTNGLADGLNYIGVKPDAQYGNDVNDFHEIPAAPGAASLAIAIPGETGLFRTDYRPQFSDGATWDITLTKADKRILTLSGLNNIPDGMKAWLIISDEAKMLLTDNVAVELDNEITSAELVVGTEEYLKDRHNILVPDAYALSQNYPNPFNPSTSIKFALPEPADVNLEVFNILGQKVTTIKKGRMTAGYHVETWDGTSDDGRPAASGVYFYRITANSFSEQKKMLLLK